MATKRVAYLIACSRRFSHSPCSRDFHRADDKRYGSRAILRACCPTRGSGEEPILGMLRVSRESRRRRLRRRLGNKYGINGFRSILAVNSPEPRSPDDPDARVWRHDASGFDDPHCPCRSIDKSLSSSHYRWATACPLRQSGGGRALMPRGPYPKLPCAGLHARGFGPSGRISG